MNLLEKEIADWIKKAASVKSNRCQLNDIDEEAAREGKAIKESLKIERPQRRKNKVPGWQRFKVKYHV